jgi:hypothetical protein
MMRTVRIVQERSDDKRMRVKARPPMAHTQGPKLKVKEVKEEKEEKGKDNG